MRLTRLLKLSFVGAVLFSPAMADDAEKIHEEALRILHEKMANPGADQNNSITPATSATTATTPTSSTAPTISPSSTKPTSKTISDAERARAEREQKLNAEVKQRLQERERLQAEKRRQFEDYVKERERLRQQQRDYDENIARQTGQLKSSANQGASADEIHSKALDVLHQTTSQPANNSGNAQPSLQPAPNHSANSSSSSGAVERATTANSSPPPASISTSVNSAAEPRTDATANENAIQQRALQILHEHQVESGSSTSSPGTAALPVKEAEVAPRVLASSAAQADSTAETQAKALEVLHQQMQAQRNTQPEVVTNSTAQPSPYLQQRLKEMHEELNTAPSKSNSSTSVQPAAVPDDYIKDLERRARQSTQQQTAPAATIVMPGPAATPASAQPPQAPVAKTAPGLDQKTREMLERQDRELSRETGSSPTITTSATPGAPPRSAETYSTSLPPDAEARARELLHQQQQQQAVSSTPPSAPATTVQNVAPVTAPDTTQVQYSKELEERARQTLLERAQTQQSTAPLSSPMTTVTPPPSTSVAQPSTRAMPPATTAVTSSTSPTTSANTEQIHEQALQTLNQIGPKTKQERLRELTDLYKADKMSPAEYHQKRAAILAEPK